MTGFLLLTIPLALVLGLAAPVWLRARSWLLVLRAMAAILFGMLVPLVVFLLSAFFQPDWKGACKLHWVDCFHQGKLVLLPVILWAMMPRDSPC